ncbi:hypothetical protein IQ288_13550 [Burkholderia sp. R-69980]|nr:hypothetical protein [Burkholderia sp. R-69980]
MPDMKRRSVRVEPQHGAFSGESWLEQHRKELPKDSWVAARGSHMVAHARDIGDLMRDLREKHVDPNDVTIIFNESRPA